MIETLNFKFVSKNIGLVGTNINWNVYQLSNMILLSTYLKVLDFERSPLVFLL